MCIRDSAWCADYYLSAKGNDADRGTEQRPWKTLQRVNRQDFRPVSYTHLDVYKRQNLYGRRKAMDLFAQDSWKVTPKLTLNIGLRWDATLRLHEKYGHWANFDLNAVDPNLGIPGTVVYASGGSDSFEKNEDWHNLGPNIGIAWNRCV